MCLPLPLKYSSMVWIIFLFKVKWHYEIFIGHVVLNKLVICMWWMKLSHLHLRALKPSKPKTGREKKTLRQNATYIPRGRWLRTVHHASTLYLCTHTHTHVYILHAVKHHENVKFKEWKWEAKRVCKIKQMWILSVVNWVGEMAVFNEMICMQSGKEGTIPYMPPFD